MRSHATRCEARPPALRSSFADDALCACVAHTTVQYHGSDVAVCRMHAATYAAWGDEAEPCAARIWEWTGAVPRRLLPAPAFRVGSRRSSR